MNAKRMRPGWPFAFRSKLPSAISLVMLAWATSVQPAPQWWALDTMPEGTPPTILCQTGSDPYQTLLYVTIHGFWYEVVQEASQTFYRLSLNGAGDEAVARELGRPDLPALHHLIGDLTGGAIQVDSLNYLDFLELLGIDVYPAQPARNEDEEPTTFYWDQTFYQQMTQPYPTVPGATLGYRGRFDGLDLLAAETYPFRAIPATHTLQVAREFTVTLTHMGTAAPTTRMITRRQARQYELALDNYDVVSMYRQIVDVSYAGDYLIITAPLFEDEIHPLARQKRCRGYSVSVVTTDITGATCDDIKDYIANWWAAGDPDRDHYVLLVGDVADIPVCVSEDGTDSDKVYACIDGLGDDGLPDVYPEVRLGRFSCTTEAECSDMVTKTLTYERGFPGLGGWLGDVLLTCHKRADDRRPDQYRDAQETVRLYPYTSPPSFSTLYGQDGATDAQVRAAVDGGLGLFCYRGHGSFTSWGIWNNAGEIFNRTDVGLLANGIMTPVVLSIACGNSAVGEPECLGECWLKTTERAVAHFGATSGSSRTANDLLDLELFETIYEDHHAILSEAIAGAEMATIISHPRRGEYNAWQYLLLGDPELEVWTEPPAPLVITATASEIPPEPTILTINVNIGSGFRSVNVFAQ